MNMVLFQRERRLKKVQPIFPRLEWKKKLKQLRDNDEGSSKEKRRKQRYKDEIRL